VPLKVWLIVQNVSNEADLRRQVARWDACGLGGVLITDHMFISQSGTGKGVSRALDRDSASPLDPFTLLGSIGALSSSLELGTIVANLGLLHPIFVIRHFAQLACMFGSDRVIAGLGAGWNAEEFEAIGLEMLPHPLRLARLEEAATLARRLFREGVASLDGATLTARELPLSPFPSSPPRLLLGGGSDQFLSIAGRVADHIDLNGSSRRQKLGRVAPADADRARRLTTTIADLEDSIEIVGEAAAASGRNPSEISYSVLIDSIEFCRSRDIADREAGLRERRHATGAEVSACPYALIGDVARMRDLLAERVARLGLSTVIVRDGEHLEPFMSHVVTASGGREQGAS
jgi:alkanesulfonate monooxygenase SsuD/methylene tetrahydromethanopterin reductase-like flavin-dependent oxidoreductase (luciferase family)